MNIKKGFTRLLVTALALCVMIACFPVGAFAADNITVWSSDKTIDGTLYVSKPIEIKGTVTIELEIGILSSNTAYFSHILRDSNYYQRSVPMITVKSGANVIINGGGGGAISGASSYSAHYNTDSNAPLIYVEEGARLTLVGVHVGYNNNEAVNKNSPSMGGGIVNKGIFVTDQASVISNCSADYGGGLYNQGNAYLLDTTVSNCVANIGGGGIYNAKNSLFEIGNDSTIRNCNVLIELEDYYDSMYGWGGGIYNEGTTSLSNTIIENCKVTDDDYTSKYGWGGGIHNESGNLTVYQDCEITECIAMHGGGVSMSSGSVSIEDSQLTKNVGLYGGAVSVANQNNDVPAVLTIGKQVMGFTDPDVLIKENDARHGAGVYLTGNTDGSYFHKVQISNNLGNYGVGVYMDTCNGKANDYVYSMLDYKGATLTMTSYTEITSNKDGIYYGKENDSTFGVFVGAKSVLKLDGLPIMKNNQSNYLYIPNLGIWYGSQADIVVESSFRIGHGSVDEEGVVELLKKTMPLTRDGFEPIGLERWTHAYTSETGSTSGFSRTNGQVMTGYKNLGLPPEDLKTYFVGYNSYYESSADNLFFTDKERNIVHTGAPRTVTVICGEEEYEQIIPLHGVPFYLDSTVHIPGKKQTGWQIGDTIYGVDDALYNDSEVNEIVGIYEEVVYTITFHSNSYDSPNWTATIPIRYGETVTLNPNVSGLYYDDATLDGWSTTPYAYYADYELGTTFTLTEEKNVDLYAHWEHTKVTYVFTGIDGCYELSDTNEGGALARNPTNDYTVVFNFVDEAVWWSLPDPYKTGYDFLYWEYRGRHFEAGDNLDEQAVGGNDTYFVFTAVFEPIQVSVTYNSNEGSLQADTVSYGEEYTVREADASLAPPSAGHYFYAYTATINGKTETFFPGDTIVVDWLDTVNLETVWRQYNATFNVLAPDEATVENLPLSFLVGTKTAKLNATVNLNGYDHIGWRLLIPGLEDQVFSTKISFDINSEEYACIVDYVVAQDERDVCYIPAVPVMLAQDGIPYAVQAYVQNGQGEFELISDAIVYAYGTTDTYTVGQNFVDELLAMIPDGENYTFSHAEDAVITFDGSAVSKVYLGLKRTYTVEHYQQNVDNDEYTLVSADTQTLYGSGTTDAHPNEYDGFTAQPIEQAEIAEDGSTIVKVYYNRNVYTIRVNLDGGILDGVEDIQVKYRGRFYLPQETPVKAGFTFGGWAMYIDGKYTATFQGEDLEGAFSLNVPPVEYAEAKAVWTPRAISDITLGVTHQTYEIGDEFVPFNATITYDNGDVEEAPVTVDMLSGFSTESLVENQTVTITVGGHTVTFTMTVTPKTYTVTYDINGADGSAPQTAVLQVGASFTPAAADEITKNGYHFSYWQDELSGLIYRVGNTYEMPENDIVLRAMWALNMPVLSGSEGAITFHYDGSPRTASIQATHELDDAVITYRWYKLKAGESPIPSIAFSVDLYFESRCELLSETDGDYDFTNISDSGTYYCVVTATHGEETSQTAREIVVTVKKALPKKELTQTEFTYAPNMTISFFDYLVGEGGMVIFTLVDKNGVEFDYSEGSGRVYNITKAGGTFTLLMTVYEDETHVSATETYTITLNKAQQTMHVTASPSTPTFLQTVSLSVSSNKGELHYAITSGNATMNGNKIVPGGAGVVEYSVTADETDLYEAVTNHQSITFKKAAGNLAPDYEKPTGLTVCIDHTSDDLALPEGWSWNGTHTFDQVMIGLYSAIFTPADDNYEPYTVSLSVTVTNHNQGDPANCTNPRICTLCKAVLVPKQGHDYSNVGTQFLRTQGANCQEYNTYWKYCWRCGCSAGEDPEATDQWTVGTVTGNHNMLADWIYEDGQHYQKCAIDGCDYKENLEDCSGGKATCQAQAVCSICYNSYGSLGDHEYDLSTFGHQDADGHAHRCLYCNAHDTLQAHVPNLPAATEDLDQVCTVEGCGFLMQPSLGHTHFPSDEWEWNSQSHWHDCVSNDGQQYDMAPHTFDDECDTTCNEGCGYVRVVNHDYTVMLSDHEEHWLVCSICLQEKQGSRNPHSGGTATCQNPATCGLCNTSYGTTGDHECDLTRWVSIDDTNHGHRCKHCDAFTDIAEHSYTDSEMNSCDFCGHSAAQECNHHYALRIEDDQYLMEKAKDCMSFDRYYLACEYCFASAKGDTGESFESDRCGEHDISPEWSSDGESHYHACLTPNCEHREDEQECFGGHSDCQNIAVCVVCKNKYGQYGDHVWEDKWVSQGQHGHAHRCTVSNCGAIGDVFEHNPDIPEATETQAQVCLDCGCVMQEKLPSTTDLMFGDVNGDGKVTAVDALEVLKSVVGKVTLPDDQSTAADTDGNGKADAADALNILKKVVGKIDKFPVEE